MINDGQEKCLYNFLPDGTSFESKEAAGYREIYFPLCGINSGRLKSSITPYLSGDIKIDKFRYLTKPVSREGLRHAVRNFFVIVNGNEVISLVKDCPDEVPKVEIGQMWHKLVKVYPARGLEIEALNFIPVTGENVELMRVRIKNVSGKTINISSIAALPIFGRALANKHDHEHVTSLLQRIEQVPFGVIVHPTMLFNEKGHLPGNTIYFVLGIDGRGDLPEGSFPTIESFYGDSGTEISPEAVIKNISPSLLPKERLCGKEAIGALRFKEDKLEPGQSAFYFIAMGICDNRDEAEKIRVSFNSPEKFDLALAKNKEFWRGKSRAISFDTGDKNYNSWTRWVAIQPVLRRIFGCSFLPDHDYGKGGRGWRDIWQDILSLILIEPETVRETIINNFAGVRIDGSNATIIGPAFGEFIADRNAITRVWSDHGAWPFMTVSLYVNQTGDYDVLLEENTYFKDSQLSRTFKKDVSWAPEYGNCLKDKNGRVVKSSLIEHILVQHLVQFFNVGEHNLLRLESADWNDALDMAFERGEAVTFMSCYGGNLLELADMLDILSERNAVTKISLSKEILILLDSLSGDQCNYEIVEQKKTLLFEKYFNAAQPEISGEKVEVGIKDLARDLRKKGQWIFQHIRKNEIISIERDGRKYTWFNGYYDNKGVRVEGQNEEKIRMTLAGQAFPVMSGMANTEEIQDVVESVNFFLKDKKLGGYRLNTDFGLCYYPDFGRAFGFAYGTKENGAFFNHMIVMYAYGLYKRRFVKEGFKVLQSIYRMARNTAKSKIYPGIPEYMDSEGRGMYHYLTGAASWFVLTKLTQVYGVRGSHGDLLLSPKLVKEEFDGGSTASVTCRFAGKKLKVIYINKQCLDYGEYAIEGASIQDNSIEYKKILENEILIKRDLVAGLDREVTIQVYLGRKL